MATKLLCLSSANTSSFAKVFLEYLANHAQVKYDYAEIEPHILAKVPFPKLLSHFCTETPDYVMSFDGHYRFIKNDPGIPFIEMGNSVAGPIKTNRVFLKNPVSWENRVVKVEPSWYAKVLPIEDKTIYNMVDSYRYVYLRHLVEKAKSSGVGKELPYAFYVPDWNTHTDDILNNIYRFLDFCREDHCGLHVALSPSILDSKDMSWEEKYKVKRKSIDTTLKIMQDEIAKFNRDFQADGLVSKITDNTNYEMDILRYNIRLLAVEPSSTAWLEILYMLKVKGAECNKMRVVLANGKRFPGTDDFDKTSSDVEKYFKENLMRRDKTQMLGYIYTTTDRFYNFLSYQENFALSMDFKKIEQIIASGGNPPAEQ